MKESIASAPASVWNRKNLPSAIERLPQRPSRTTQMAKQLPGAVMGFARRQPGLVILSLAVLAGLGLAWYLAERD